MTSNAKIICVLGIRSGTSLLTRALNLLGVYLGPEEHLMEPNTSNPKGFWEHEPFVDLNRNILSRLGGTWRELPIFAPGWEDAPEFAALRERGRKLIHESFRKAKLWGWKDPRTCVTLPFWQQLLPPMHYVICMRNPIDVAQSLEDVYAQGLAGKAVLSFENGANLWLAYMSAVLRHTTGKLRLFVFYEDMMHDWKKETQRLSTFLGVPEETEIRSKMEEFIDGELRHHHTSFVEVIGHAELPFPAKQLYMSLLLYQSVVHDEICEKAGTWGAQEEEAELESDAK